MKARDIMTTQVATVAADATVAEAAALMLDRRVSGLPVVDASGAVIGMLSEGDLVRRAELGTAGRRSWWLGLLSSQDERARDFVKTHATAVRDVMTRAVRSIGPEEEMPAIARQLERARVKRLPVIEDGRLLGIVSRADLLRGLAAARDRAPAPVHTGDRALRDAILETVHAQDWTGGMIFNVVVSDGVAHLWGVADSEDQRRAVHVAVKGVPGVTGIEDHLGREIPS